MISRGSMALVMHMCQKVCHICIYSDSPQSFYPLSFRHRHYPHIMGGIVTCSLNTPYCQFRI